MDFKEVKTYIKNIVRGITNEYNEDLEQEVLIKLWKNKDKYKEQGNSKAWIKTVSANLTKDYLKSSGKKLSDNTLNDDEILLTVKDFHHSPENNLLRRERQKRISVEINRLKPKFREIIILYEIENCSYEEISKKLKCPIGTVKSRLYNAKKELAQKLEDLL